MEEIRKKYLIISVFSVLVMLAYFGTKTMPMQTPSKTYQETFSNLDQEAALPSTDIFIESSTTTTTVVELTTTTIQEEIVETTTTTRVVRQTTTTEPYVSTTVPQVRGTLSSGPPRNTTTLVGCIAYYESTWGQDPNVFQFTQGTWQTYGGTGSPSNAPYWRQEEVFWLAWTDDGEHHWAAQKGRCF